MFIVYGLDFPPGVFKLSLQQHHPVIDRFDSGFYPWDMPDAVPLPKIGWKENRWKLKALGFCMLL